MSAVRSGAKVQPRFAAGALRGFAAALLTRAGLPADRAATVAAVLVEADLMGHTTRWTGAVFIQIIDPDSFGGRDAFLRETSWMARACRTVPVKPGNPPVRMPGERGLALRKRQLAEGVDLYPGIMDALSPWAKKLGLEMPRGQA